MPGNWHVLDSLASVLVAAEGVVPMKLPKLRRGKRSLTFGILAVFLVVVIFSRQRLRTAVVFAVVTAVVVCERRLKRAQAEEVQPAPSEAPEKPSPAPVVSAAAEASRPADPPPPAPLPEKAEKYLRIARNGSRMAGMPMPRVTSIS